MGTAMPNGGNADSIGIEDQVDQMFLKYYQPQQLVDGSTTVTGYTWVPGGPQNQNGVNTLIPTETSTQSSASAPSASTSSYNYLPKVIVGQSMGGVRALGFASKYPNQTAAVITIGSPVTGHPMLLNPQTTKTQISNAVNIIADGFANVLGWGGDVVLAVASPILKADGYGSDLGDQVVNILLGVAYNNVAPNSTNAVNLQYIGNMISNPTTVSSVPGLADLAPNSSFFNKWINPSSTSQTTTYKVQVGTEYAPEIVNYAVFNNDPSQPFPYGMPGFPPGPLAFPIIQTVSNPNYEYYQVVKQGGVPKISSSTPVYFIRGTDNDELNLLKAMSPNDYQTALDIKSAYLSITEDAYNFWTGYSILVAAAMLAYTACGDLPDAGLSALIAATAIDAATYCENGHDWVANYINNIGTILGDTSNDSFIPESAQSWDTTIYGGTTFLSTIPTSSAVPTANHVSELSDPTIWGTGGSMSAAYSGGIITQLLKSLPQNVLVQQNPSTYSGGASYAGPTD